MSPHTVDGFSTLGNTASSTIGERNVWKLVLRFAFFFTVQLLFLLFCMCTQQVKKPLWNNKSTKQISNILFLLEVTLHNLCAVQHKQFVLHYGMCWSVAHNPQKPFITGRVKGTGSKTTNLWK
jgi:hypothetical protein